MDQTLFALSMNPTILMILCFSIYHESPSFRNLDEKENRSPQIPSNADAGLMLFLLLGFRSAICGSRPEELGMKQYIRL